MNWIVVASQKEARVFIKTSEKIKLKLLKSLINPLGQEKKKSLIRKQAGRGLRTTGRLGSVGYRALKRHDPHEEAVIQFAKQVVEFLEKERKKRNFEALTFVAEPRFLGKIKANMGRDLKNSVTKWVKKDLQKTPKKELIYFLVPKNLELARTDPFSV